MMLPAKVVFLFTALTMNAAGHVDDGQFIRTKTMAQCRELEKTYNSTQQWQSEYGGFLGKLRWSTDCRIVVLAEHRSF